jgi:hypothetical protein
MIDHEGLKRVVVTGDNGKCAMCRTRMCESDRCIRGGHITSLTMTTSCKVNRTLTVFHQSFDYLVISGLFVREREADPRFGGIDEFLHARRATHVTFTLDSLTTRLPAAMALAREVELIVRTLATSPRSTALHLLAQFSK